MLVMERGDSRLLPVAALNERRRRAVKLRLSGMKLQQVCALPELSKGVYCGGPCLPAWRLGGGAGTSRSGERGRLHSRRAIVTTIRGLIHAHTSDQGRLPYAL